MNSINTYKALTVVANVEQGLLIKRLIEENKKLNKEINKTKTKLNEAKIILQEGWGLKLCECCSGVHSGYALLLAEQLKK